jgi:hypothetical protein
MKFTAPLLAALLASPALAAPGASDVARAATRTAQALNGVLRDCPASFAAAQVGTPQKKCVGVGGAVEQNRVRLSAALGADLYGVWRSRDGQRSVYNWLRTPGGYVYLRLQPGPDARTPTLAYLDVPPDSPPTPSAAPTSPAATPQGGRVTVTPARPAPTRAAPVRPASPTPAASPTPRPAAVPTLAPVPFTRPLRLTDPRLNGADVRAAQDRLIALTRPSGGGRGDGWYGPVTAATVRAFQAANALPVTGQVDRATWNALFSARARTLAADRIR